MGVAWTIVFAGFAAIVLATWNDGERQRLARERRDLAAERDALGRWERSLVRREDGPDGAPCDWCSGTGLW
jgi:hypothetical protein